MKEPRERPWLRVVLIIVITAEIYLPVINHHFSNWDDPKHIQVIWEPSFQKAYKILTDLDLSFTQVSYYGPIPFLSWMMEQSLSDKAAGPQPWISKLGNVIFHILNTLLVFMLLLRLGLSNSAAFFAALFFAIHPIQVGTVAWVSERKSLTCALGYLGALIVFRSYLDHKKVSQILLLFVLFTFALLSKPQAVTLPVVLSAWLLVERIKPDRRLFFILVAMFGVSIFWGLYVMSSEGGGHDVLPQIIFRPLILCSSVLFYIRKILIPYDFVPVYPRWDVPGNWPFFVPALSACAIAGAALWKFRKRIAPEIQWGIVFFAVNIALVSGIIPFGFMAHSFVSDHFMYIPIVGIVIVVGILFDKLRNSIRRPNFSYAAICCMYTFLALCGIQSIRQTIIWSDPESLWKRNLEVNQNSSTVYCNYAAVFMEKGSYEEALPLLQKAVELSPAQALFYKNAGQVYWRMDKLDNAQKMFETTLALEPSNQQNYLLLASVMRRKEEFQRAEDLLEIASEYFPKSAPIRNELGLLYAAQEKFDKAEPNFRAAIELDPDLTESYTNLGAIKLNQDRLDESVQFLEDGLRRQSDPFARKMLGTAYAKLGDHKTAIHQFREAIKLKPDFEEAKKELTVSLEKLKAKE